MMFETSVTLTIKAKGKIDKSDYDKLQPVIQNLIQAQGDINLLLDMTGFKGENLNALKEDLTLGQNLSDKVEKMALVGDKKWEKWTAKLMDSFFSKEAEYFQSADIDKAWTWLGQ
jgi:hypothetical protein